MRKLLLASNGKFLFDHGYALLGIPFPDLNIGYVTTASKGIADRDYLESHKTAMKERGMRFTEIDIEGKSESELRELFQDKNAIHIEGGNTFYLLKAVKTTGFDKIILEFINKGVVYIGTSAGAYIACPTIEVSTWGPDAKDRYGLTDFTGLNIVPFLLRVHYTDELKGLVQEKMKVSKYPLRILRDGQGILVEGGKYTFVGEGKEVLFGAI